MRRRALHRAAGRGQARHRGLGSPHASIDETADWISKAGVEPEKIRSLELRDAGGRRVAWKMERSGDNADWKLAGARGNEKLEVGMANAAAYTFGRIEIADVAPKVAEGGGRRPRQARLVTATTLEA